MSDDDYNPTQVAFYVYGIDADEIDYVWNIPEDYEREHDEPYPGDGPRGYSDHEAHEAATVVMEALKSRFEWAADITGVAMGTKE